MKNSGLSQEDAQVMLGTDGVRCMRIEDMQLTQACYSGVGVYMLMRIVFFYMSVL